MISGQLQPLNEIFHLGRERDRERASIRDAEWNEFILNNSERRIEAKCEKKTLAL